MKLIFWNRLVLLNPHKKDILACEQLSGKKSCLKPIESGHLMWLSYTVWGMDGQMRGWMVGVTNKTNCRVYPTTKWGTKPGTWRALLNVLHLTGVGFTSPGPLPIISRGLGNAAACCQRCEKRRKCSASTYLQQMLREWGAEIPLRQRPRI